MERPFRSRHWGRELQNRAVPTAADGLALTAPSIAVHDLGGRGDALLICPATGFCGRAYEPLAEALGRHRHVFAVDLRGHGESPLPEDGDLSWPSIAQDVMTAVRSIGGGPIHLFGHSIGGAVAMYAEATSGPVFASAFLYEPIIMGPGVGDMTGHPNPMAQAARKRVEVFPSKEAALERYSARPPLNTLSDESLRAYVEHGFEDLDDGTVRLRCRRETEARVFEAVGGVTTQSIAGVDIPTIVATCVPQLSMLANLAPAIIEAVGSAQHLVYEDLGHFGPLQAPERVAHDLIEFSMATG
jgi:pimeloyl-ACP methyl ester carboxylesterase